MSLIKYLMAPPWTCGIYFFLVSGYCFAPRDAFSQAEVTNQRVYDTAQFIPEHYPQRMAIFQKEPVVTGRIIFLGNSITEMGNWGKLLNDSTVINRGIGGDNTYGVKRRLNDIIIRSPSKLFILIGINDIGKDIPDTQIAENVRQIILTIQQGSPETRIYLQSILPVNPNLKGFPQHYDKNLHIIATNILLEQLAKERRVTFINLNAVFDGGDGKLKKEYTIEGLHINLKGYEAWVNYLKANGYL
jgi:lysophospholipase L1-like esterase